MNNQAISKVELQKLINTKNSFVDLSVKYSLGINTDEFAKFPSFFDQRLTENQEQISSLGNELESVQGELTETQATLSQTQADLQEKTEELEQTEISLQEKTEELQAKTDELEEFTGEVNTIKDGIADEVNKVESFYITPETPFSEYPQKVEQAISKSNRYGYNIGVNDEKSYWTELVNSATATAENVEAGKTFVNRNGEIESGTLEVETLKEAGRKEAYDEFWNKYQLNGNRTDYRYDFGGSGWTQETLKPKYVIRPVGGYATAMFKYCNRNTNMPILDMSKVPTDFSQCTELRNIFECARVKNVYVDASNATTIDGAFAMPDWGEIISVTIKLTEKCTYIGTAFAYNSSIEELIFTDDSVVAVSGLYLAWSTLLNKKSIISIINALSGTTSGISVTLNRNAVNKAFETSSGANDGSTSQEWLNLIATKSNWTISLG